jgi:zinc transport system substrate-binding protein
MPIRPLLFCLLLLVGAPAQAQLQVIVSLAPYGSLVEQIAGDMAEVMVMLPSGASPHTFEPTPRMAAALAGADLVVLNGSVDEWLHELVEAANPGVPVFEALELLEEELEALAIGEAETLASGHEGEERGEERREEGGEDEDGEGHLYEGVNPHVWLDPVLTASLVQPIGEALAGLDPVNSTAYRERSAALAADLLALDRELRETLSAVAGAPFIPFHDAWPYFALRYGLDLLIEIEPFPGREPSPRYLAEAVRTIRESGAPAIFTEVGLNDRPGRVLASEARVELHVLDPLGGARERYQDLLRRNAETIVEAFRTWQRD